jgi:hypothetical protein
MCVALGLAAIWAAAARSEFLGLLAQEKTDPGAAELGLRLCNAYAVFDDPQDRLAAVAGEAANRSVLVIETDDPGGFFQHLLGGDTAPTAQFIEFFPDLAYDTFVTIGVKVDDGTDQTRLAVLWPGFRGGALIVDNSAWFVTPGAPQAAPGPDGRVLIGQFTVGMGYGVSGQGIELVWVAGNGSQSLLTNLCFDCPPGMGGDLDGNGVVGAPDLLILLSVWGRCEPCSPCPGDLDGDGAVGITDLLLLLAGWG